MTKEDKLSNQDRFANYFGSSDIQMDIYHQSENFKQWNNLYRKVLNENNIIYAIKRLQNNKGRNTPGPNGITFNEYTKKSISEIKEDIEQLLNTKQHLIRTVKIPKANGKTRTLGIADIQVRIAQQCILNIIECILEPHFSPRSYGYRRNKSAQLCVGMVSTALLSLNTGYVYDCDLKGYFDTIPLNRVLLMLKKNHGIKDRKLLTWIKNIMSCSTNENYNGIGLAQGSILGPTLANVMLHDWEEKLARYNGYEHAKDMKNGNSNFRKNINKELKKGTYHTHYKQKHKNLKVGSMYRFADDFVIIGPDLKDLQYIISNFKIWCKKNGLTINEEKTRIIEKTEQGIELDFLGYHIRINEKNKIVLSPKNQQKKKKELIRKLKRYLNTGKLDLFMSTIQGYMRFYDIATNLHFLIKEIDEMLYQRYRPGNTKRGTKTKRIQHGIYELIPFNATHLYRNKPYIIDLWGLRKLTSTSYDKYIKDKNKHWKPKTNEYNETEWIKECIKHHNKKVASKLAGFIPGLIRIRKREPILEKDYLELDPGKMHIHHVIPLSMGGTHDFSNLVLLHSNSHKAIHYDVEPLGRYNKKKLEQYRKKAHHDTKKSRTSNNTSKR